MNWSRIRGNRKHYTGAVKAKCDTLRKESHKEQDTFGEDIKPPPCGA